MKGSKINRPGGKITFRSKGAFWIGFLSVAVGVALQLPMYINAADMGYKLVGMQMSTAMYYGMALVIFGLAITLYSLIPPAVTKENTDYNFKIRALDDAPINKTHIGLLFVMALAVTLDVMKPTILSFVVPGVAAEYGLKSPINPNGTIPVALLPLCGITGTVLGSFLWGWLGDRIGRRSSILMAGITFIATSSCGSMPSFWMNCVMCLVMGYGVGGHVAHSFYTYGRKYTGKAQRLADGAYRWRYCRRLHYFKCISILACSTLLVENTLADWVPHRLYAYFLKSLDSRIATLSA